MRVLHLGCGRKGKALPAWVELGPEPPDVSSLDANPDVDPDALCALGADAIPYGDNTFDVAVAIHSLEHIGRPGETKEWFQFWEEVYRVLKPGGRLIFESPLFSSVWAWADPSHTRAMSTQSFIYFSQDSYRMPGSGISPFRIHCDFVPIWFEGIKDTNYHISTVESVSHFRGELVAVKPLKAWWLD